MAIIYDNVGGWGSLDAYIAHLPGVRRELSRTAREGGQRAEAILRAHRHAGHARITVTKGDRLDWFVNLDDTRGLRAAAAIEFGRGPGGWHRGNAEGIHALRSAF
jgi:hypothetical protein